MSDVFISYSRKDSEIVDRIEQELDKYGITSFIDRSAIDLGDDFAEVIAKALFECQIVLFVWSENSNQSENTANEIALAIDFEKTIVSFKIGTFKSDYKLAYRLVRFNRIDAVPFNEDKIVELGKKLSQQLGKKLKDKSEDKKADNVQERDNVKPSIDKSVHKNVDESKYESSYKFGKSALLEFDLPSAFSDLLEPALNDYKDSRELIAGIVDYRSRIFPMRSLTTLRSRPIMVIHTRHSSCRAIIRISTLTTKSHINTLKSHRKRMIHSAYTPCANAML